MAELVPSQVTSSATVSTSTDKKKRNVISNNKGKKQRSRSRKSTKKGGGDGEVAKAAEAGGAQNKNKNTHHRKKNKKRFPWRKHIQEGMVDPISLEPLITLPYPPFALAITEPYIPIKSWPTSPSQQNNEDVSSSNSSHERNKKQEEEMRQAQIIQEQWGSTIIGTSKSNDAQEEATTLSKAAIMKTPQGQTNKTENQYNQPSETNNNTTNKHVHLFDGKVLAAYLVSQLQFIDPLNRRDLTREEIQNLDEYLKRHKIKHASVLEAYESKGITLNSAGISGQSRSGRAEILQEEAQRILHSLFQHSTPSQMINLSNYSRRRRGNSSRPRVAEEGNNFARQYEAHESRNDRVNPNRYNRNVHNSNQISTQASSHLQEGVFNDTGMTIIDDNLNPGLRSVTAPSDIMNNLNQHRQEESDQRHLNHFPTLAATTIITDTSTSNETNQSKPTQYSNGKISKSLMKIGKVVKKTDPKEIQRQKEAREEHLRKIELANLPFEEFLLRKEDDNKPLELHKEELSRDTVEKSLSENTLEKKLERNKILADALGVQPSTIRNSNHGLRRGWKRPTNTKSDINEFGKELNEIEYPYDLIIEAQERLEELKKLEKIWITWLSDDTAASCSLKKMDRATRIFVHKYSDYWNIQTQSYDPEPKRYIHCVKLLETYTPFPLLSSVVKKGPDFINAIQKQHKEEEITFSSTRVFPKADDRVPLKLTSRSVPLDNSHLLDNSVTNNNHDNRIQYQGNEEEPSERFAALLADREKRKTLILHPRTKPLELPPYQQSEEKEELYLRKLKKEQAEVKRKQQKERKQQILEAAFASDDEDSESSWEVDEAVFSYDDEEEE